MKKQIGFYPTPLHRLNNLSTNYEGYEFFCKRDDLTGLATGGNKVRKLEYLLAEAIENEKSTIVTVGSQQSNHCRQTAAACRLFGLDCHLVLNGIEPETYDGNLLLSRLFGANIHFCNKKTRKQKTAELLQQLAGEATYFIPVGGSNLTGSLGYADAMNELKDQQNEQNISIDYLFVASGSGGTHAGIQIGKEIHDMNCKIHAIRIDKMVGENSIESHTLEIINQGMIHFGSEKKFLPNDISVLGGYDEAGYSVITENEKSAVKEMAMEEGILLDPVYTGRAFYGMMDQVKRKIIPKGSSILFWHTGGTPSNFHYKDALK